MIRGLRDKRKGQEKKKITFLPSPHSSTVSGCSGNILYLKLYRYDESFLWSSRTIRKVLARSMGQKGDSRMSANPITNSHNLPQGCFAAHEWMQFIFTTPDTNRSES